MSGSRGSALILVENLAVPFDRRVWMMATTLQQDGWQVTVVSPASQQWPAAHEVLDGVEVWRHPQPPEGTTPLGFLREYAAALWHEAALVRRVWRRQRFDVIHICNPPDLLFLIAAWYRAVHGVRVVFDQHDLGPELFVAKYGRRGVLHRLLVWCERLTYLTAHRVIATNDSYREIAIDRGGKVAAHVAVVRSAPDVERFRPVSPDDRYRDGAKHLIGYVGVMGSQEGLDLLLRGLHYLVSGCGRDDVRAMFIGGGPALEQLRELARELRIDHAVEFTGRVSDEELIARLSSVDVCVAPDPVNGFNELCTMNKVLEYMALGKPVVQFDVKEGRRSAAEASVYARPNAPEDLGKAIIDLLDSGPERLAEMGRTGRKRMEDQLGWSHQRPVLLDLYRSIGAG